MNEMKRKLFHTFIAAVFVLSLFSCAKGVRHPDEFGGLLDAEDTVIDRNIAVTDLLTIKRSDSGEAYFRLGHFKLWPDMEFDYDLPQRALASLTITPDRINDYYKCIVDWIEPLENGVLKSSPDYASAPRNPDAGLDLLLDSDLTMLEDGFLSLHYNTWWGEHAVHHDFSLIGTENSGGVCTLSLVQDRNGDSKDYLSEGIICFDLSSLREPGGEHKTISLNWIKLDGTEGTARFELE